MSIYVGTKKGAVSIDMTRDAKLVSGKNVRVNGIVYDIRVDKHGVFRFPEQQSGSKINLNQVSIDYQKGQLTTRQCAEAFMSVGYSIDGWCDAVDDLLEVVLDNPHWADLWLSAPLRKDNGDDKDDAEDDDDDAGDDNDASLTDVIKK